MSGHYKTPEERFAAAADRPAADPVVTPGSTICRTPQAIERFRMCTLLQALDLEAKGIRISRGFSALATARKEYGITARTAADAYTKLRTIMTERGII